MVVRRFLRRLRRKPRVFRSRIDPFDELDDEQIRQRYRFTKDSIDYIVGLIRDDIEHPTAHNYALSPRFQVLLALRFYATGSFQEVLADTIRVHKSTVCRCVWRVTKALVKLLDDFVYFPEGERLETVQAAFKDKCGIPGIVGCIDGTQIRISGPTQNEYEFVNRKGYHAINCQFICDHQGFFTNVVANWPGSTHDSRILSESLIGRQFQSGQQKGILLGDSGYPLKTWLLTPYPNPKGQGQLRYNSAHCNTRSCIERTFGQLKRRFSCLHNELRLNPNGVCLVIGACAVLHNVAVMLREDDFGHEIPTEDDEFVFAGPANGKSYRDDIVQLYFTR